MDQLDIQYYLELQKRMKEIFLFVSCNKENYSVYSIKIENLFVDSCAFFDSLAQTLIRENIKKGLMNINPKHVKSIDAKVEGRKHFNMGDYRLILEEHYLLSEKEIILNSYDEKFREFKKFQRLKNDEGFRIKPLHEWSKGKSTEWWNNFTSLKHDRLNNIKLANFKSLIESLGGVFILLAFRNEEYFKKGEVPDDVYDVFFPLFWEKGGMIHRAAPTFR